MMSTGPHVLFYVQHLLGIGHLKRAATLARTMAGEGLAVTLVSGGMEVPILDRQGFDLVQLDPVRANDRTFGTLVGVDGEELNEEGKEARRDALLEVLHKVKPAILLIELYPFGRRQLGFEIKPLIEAARTMTPWPLVVSSVRDILVEKNRPERAREMAEAALAEFDHILVHGDPDFIPFGATFEPAGQLAHMTHYTGYVAEPKSADGEQGRGEVLVSAGGGATGEKLLRCALDARPLSNLAQAPWRVLAGPNLEQSVFEDLASQAGPGVTVERARADFTALLSNCRLSISQGGYNTLMEVLASGVRAITVPYGGGSETEQTLRVRLLAERGLINALDEDELTPQVMAQAIDLTISSPAPAGQAPDMGGAGTSARLIAGWV